MSIYIVSKLAIYIDITKRSHLTRKEMSNNLSLECKRKDRLVQKLRFRFSWINTTFRSFSVFLLDAP